MRRRDLIAGVAALACAPATSVRAGGMLSVAPVLLEFGPRAPGQVVTVSNPGDEAMTVQVRLFAWRNEGAEEIYEPSEDIGFSPAQFEAPAGGRQILRLVLKTPPGPTERAYRLFVDQLPGSIDTGVVALPVRMLLPVFVAPEAPAPPSAPALAWSGVVDRDARVAILTARNAGARRVKLFGLGYEAGGRNWTIAEGLAGYVLAGGDWSCSFPLVGEPTVIEVRAQTEQGGIRASVPLVYR